MNDLNCRLYTVVNMYMNGIHAGIQTAHLTHKLFSKYYSDQGRQVAPAEGKLLEEWAEYHKTIVVLKGGGHASLIRDYAEMSRLSKRLMLPHTQWHESQDALHGALTCIGVVVPEFVFRANDDDAKQIVELRDFLKRFPLAN